jgi:uncharacterized protein YdiU (UPF0061 family)
MEQSQNQFGWNFDNTYSRLQDFFFERIHPRPVSNPKIILFNQDLADSLGLNTQSLLKEGTPYFSGSRLFRGSEPIAQAYAGHQFGRFNVLGDGRAHLLGEHLTPQGQRFDIQLKGSGPTRFSRRGDGLAALGPMLREYIISEAMSALHIPTTRSLAVLATGDDVYRDQVLPGGVLTRVASSHIRVGTFEYAAALEEGRYLQILADYTLDRHDPHLRLHPEPYLAMLKAVIERQAHLIAQWMLIGFVHGVMNTDNMAISGETIDYGPCAFMDRYSPTTVFSSIDRQGRYAYGRQPSMALWNLSRLAEAMLPLLSSQSDEGIAKAEEALNTFGPCFQQSWQKGMTEKLGLLKPEEDDIKLLASLLELMEKNNADYTNTFRDLSEERRPEEPLASDLTFLEWHRNWLSRKPDFELARSRNPAVIPRNHVVEKALAAAVDLKDYSEITKLIEVIKNPFVTPQEGSDYTSPAPNGGEGYKTFCGT